MHLTRQLTIERLATWILFILLFTMAVQVPLDTDVWLASARRGIFPG